MRRFLFVAACLAAGCGAADLDDECAPLDMKCEGTSQFHCAPDVELIQRGQHVYVWQELLVCDDDEVLGRGVCVETRLTSGRVEAECDYEGPSDESEGR